MIPPLTQSFEARLDEMAGMRRLARSLLRDASLADDVVQEAALAAWRRDGEGGALPRSWWAAVVRNVAAKVRRSRERRMERERAAAPREAQPGADAVARRLALHRAVVAAVEQLAPEQRDVVVRRWFDGQKPQRIADELGVPIATVKTRLRRALERLRERLRREWGDGVAAMLLSLARPRVAASAAAAGAVATGAIVMGTKVKLALAGVVVALACAAWVAREMGRSRERARRELATVDLAGAAVADRTEDRTVEGAATREPQRLGPGTFAPAVEDPRRVAKVTGVVYGPNGPFAGARVELVRTIGRDLLIHPALRDVLPERRLRTVSAADGSFEFADVGRGVGFSIEASAEPDLFGATSRALRAGDHVLVTISAFARLVGVVHRTGGEPVAGATVVARTVGGSGVTIERATTSDAAGRFELDRMAVGPVMVQAFTADGGLMPPVRAELRSGGVTEVELAVGDGFALEGAVVDERDGHPIPDARIYFVTCEDFDVANRDIESVPIAVTDEAGRFRLHAAFEWQLPNLHASAPGYGLQSFETPKPADPAPFVEVRLRAGRAIAGRVVDAAGAPVADAVVHRRSGVDVSQTTISIRNDFGVARTAADGTFRLEDADPRTDHLLTVQHEGFADAEVRVRGDAARDADRDVGDVAMRRGALVAGTVLDAEQRPVPYASVWLESEEEPRSTDSRERFREMCFLLKRRIGTHSREDGTFSFGDVAPGRWSVTSSDSTVGGAQVSVTVQADEIHEDLELVVDQGSKISGRVVDDEGSPVPGAWISVERPPDPSPAPKIEHSPPARSAERDGTFTFDCVPAGTYRVRARFVGSQRRAAHRLAPALVENVDAGRSDLTVVMHDGAFLFGTVKNADGTNAADARVDVLDLEGRRLERAGCDANGAFEVVMPRPDPEGPAPSAARRVRLVVTGAPRDPFAEHPRPSSSTTVDDVELDGPELTIRLPPADR